MRLPGGCMGTRLTYFDRQQIAFYSRLKWNAKRIAEVIGKDRTVVWRELKRNRSPHLEYEADKAHYYSKRRAQRTNRRKLAKYPKLRAYVRRRLGEGWSPEQIAGRLKAHPPPGLAKLAVSHEAIYQFIYEEEPWLYHKLRRKQPVRYQKCGRRKNKASIPERVSIHERPEEINNRSEVGHLESDTMLCKGRKVALSVQYERKIQLVRIHQVQGFNAPETKEALKHTIESLPDRFVQSITFDNGTEGAKHHELRQEYALHTYFCDTYAAWQKGGVENMNGLLRQYLPRKTDLSQITREQLYDIQEKLNNRPRKKLNYQTPNELLAEYKGKMLH